MKSIKIKKEKKPLSIVSEKAAGPKEKCLEKDDLMQLRIIGLEFNNAKKEMIVREQVHVNLLNQKKMLEYEIEKQVANKAVAAKQYDILSKSHKTFVESLRSKYNIEGEFYYDPISGSIKQ